MTLDAVNWAFTTVALVGITGVVGTAVGFALGVTTEWKGHRKVCPCEGCREWREEERRQVLDKPSQ